MASRARRSMVGWIVVVAALAGSSAATLGAVHVTLTVFVPGTCATGITSHDASVQMSLRDSAGILKDSVPTTAEHDGSFVGCFDTPIVPTDHVRAKVGSTLEEVVIPQLTLAIDRVADTIKGKGPKGKDLRVTVKRCPLASGIGEGCPNALGRTVTVDGSGHYATDLTAALDLRGEDFVVVSRRFPSGDAVVAERDVPVFFAQSGKPFIDEVLPVGKESTFTLRASGGTLKGTVLLTGVADEDVAIGSFPLSVAAGDRITGTFPSDATMTVPDMTLSVDTTLETIDGRCFANQPYALDVFGSDGVEIQATAGGDGTFHQDVSATTNLADKDVRIECMTRRGDSITLDQHVPL